MLSLPFGQAAESFLADVDGHVDVEQRLDVGFGQVQGRHTTSRGLRKSMLWMVNGRPDMQLLHAIVCSSF